jgi:hypothetical protein
MGFTSEEISAMDAADKIAAETKVEDSATELESQEETEENVDSEEK